MPQHAPDYTLALKLARLLAAGAALQRPALLQRLGIAPTEFDEAVRQLRELGVAVVGQAGGLGLAAPLDLLDHARLRRRLEATPSIRLDILDHCDSTNTRLAARSVEPSGAALVCEHQSAGRGRRGRAWNSALGGSLTFSLLWRFKAAPAALTGLPLAVAAVLAQELERQGYGGIALKWPNDLLHQGRKLGGILVETAGTGVSGHIACIIGVGLNVRLAPQLAGAIGRPVADLAGIAAQGTRPDRTALLAGLLEALATALPLYQSQGLAAFRQAWLDRHAHQGRPVRLTLDDKLLVEGEAQGIAEDGALLVRTANGVQRVVSGEVSLR